MFSSYLSRCASGMACEYNCYVEYLDDTHMAVGNKVPNECDLNSSYFLIPYNRLLGAQTFQG